jgi:hypothetical protein
MPGMTRADMEQVDQLVGAGNIAAARYLLQSLDDPRAIKALEKLNRKYPPETVATPPPLLKPKSPPVSSPARVDLPPELRLDEMEEIKEAIREKRYDDAEALLVLSDHPDAEKLRDRLTQIRGKPMHAPKKAKKPLTTGAKVRRVVLVVLLVVVGIMGITTYQNYKRDSDAFAKELNIELSMFRVCFDAFYDDHYDRLGSERFRAACDEEVEFMRTIYTETVERCVSIWGSETYKLTECLVDGGAKFASGYMAGG